MTAVAKLKHADLWAAAKAMGSQAALARHLGIHQGELGEWINLRRTPPAQPTSGRWTEEYICLLEGKLAALTGKSWEELFPESLRSNAEFLACDKTIEKTAKLESIAIENYARSTRERLADGAVSGERRRLRRDAIEQALQSCDSRESQILKLRFGFDGLEPWTYKEIGEQFGISKERVRQIELKAIRKMQSPEVCTALLEHRL